jgi:hypothetical protein
VPSMAATGTSEASSMAATGTWEASSMAQGVEAEPAASLGVQEDAQAAAGASLASVTRARDLGAAAGDYRDLGASCTHCLMLSSPVNIGPMGRLAVKTSRSMTPQLKTSLLALAVGARLARGWWSEPSEPRATRRGSCRRLTSRAAS